VEIPFLLQLSIALLTGVVAATLAPPVRRAIPRPVEVGMWIGLVMVCSLGVMSVTDPDARDLSFSVLWAAERVVNTVFALLVGGVANWVAENRFAIASWLVIVAGADVLALMLIRSLRSAAPWQPRVRLREWMELPVATPAVVAAQPMPVDHLADVNRKLGGASALLGAAVLTHTLGLSTWLLRLSPSRDLRRMASAGRVGTHARLQFLRDASAHLSFAARAWYAGAGEPAIDGVAAKAREAQRGLRPQALRRGEVIDIQALLSAQSIGWYGPLSAGPLAPSREENDAAGSQRPGTLAS
jgi:hypothetical protein